MYPATYYYLNDNLNQFPVMKPSIRLIPILLLFFTIQAFGQTARQVSKVSITVSSLAAVLPFYEEVLTFEEVERYEISGVDLQNLLGVPDEDITAQVAVLQLGQEQIELIEFINESRQLAPPADARSNDLWFQHIAIVVSDMEAAYRRLRQYKAAHVSTAPQTLPDYLPAAAGISAFYFRDSDGHNLELIHFPEGKGNPRWQQATDRLFLGIDHTAIGISDTGRSATFYQDILGLKIAGGSENYGTEQERLNQVFGAHLLITGLKARLGFGIEFLEYLAPPGGRPYPADSRPTDLWHWHSTVVVDDAARAYRQLQEANYHFISNGIINLNNQNTFLVRDPDGHAVLIAGASHN